MKSNRNKMLVLVSVLLALASSAHAADFDPSAAFTLFGTAVTQSNLFVGGLVTLGAGLAVYAKVKGYFGKAR